MHPWCTENWLGAGNSKFFAREQPERARSIDAAARKRKNACFTERVRKRKQPKTHVPSQRFSVKQRCKNNTTPLKKQRYTTATALNRCSEIGAFSPILTSIILSFKLYRHLVTSFLTNRRK